MLQRAIEVGDTKRQQLSQRVYPSTYRGVAMWGETLAELRRQCLRRRDDWDIGSSSHFATVYCPKRNIAIAVAGGDAAVGADSQRAPRLTRKRGDKTTQRVQHNAHELYVQGVLFDAPEITKKLPPDEACQTWYLLVHPTSKEVRLELSCPTSIDGDGIVSGWHERILLPPVPISGAIAPISPDDDDDSGDAPLVGR